MRKKYNLSYREGENLNYLYLLQFIKQKNTSGNNVINQFEHTALDCAYDFDFYSANTQIKLEAKTRGIKKGFYPSYILEELKYGNIKKLKDKHPTCLFLFATITDDNYMLIWEIDTWKSKGYYWCPKTTAEEHNNIKEKKACIEFYEKDAIEVIELNSDKDKLVDIVKRKTKRKF